MAFAPGLTNAVVNFRGANAGVSAVPLFIVGGNNNGDGKVSLTDLVIGLPNTASTPDTATLSVAGANSILNVGLLEIARSGSSQPGGATITGTFNYNEGNVLANSVPFNTKNATFFTPSTATPTFIPATTDTPSSTYNLGTATTAGTLSAATISTGTTLDSAASRATLAFNNGRIQNYDPAAVRPAPSARPAARRPRPTSPSPWPEPPCSPAPAALTVDGPGTVVFNGANTYPGATQVKAGTLRATAAAYTNLLTDAGGLDLTGGRTLLDYTGTTSPVASVRTLLTTAFATNGGNFNAG